MAINKEGTRWRVDCRPQGSYGKRVRKWFDTQREAKEFEHWIMQDKGEAWHAQKADTRRLDELAALWYAQHGASLRDGQRRYRAVLAICSALGNPQGQRFAPAVFLNYRAQRAGEGITAKTLNNHLSYICAVFNELRRTGQISYDNPLAAVRPFKIVERELSFLTREEIRELLDTLDTHSDNPHVAIITRICLATGARWGEANGLRPKQLVNNRITYTNTKSGKNRTVPVDAGLFNLVSDHLSEHRQMGGSIGAFRRALARCSFELPKGQASHVLRHTFASHYMMNGGDILALQRILGHSTITMTMRYAHLAPDHLESAVRLNPLSELAGH